MIDKMTSTKYRALSPGDKYIDKNIFKLFHISPDCFFMVKLLYSTFSEPVSLSKSTRCWEIQS